MLGSASAGHVGSNRWASDRDAYASSATDGTAVVDVVAPTAAVVVVLAAGAAVDGAEVPLLSLPHAGVASITASTTRPHTDLTSPFDVRQTGSRRADGHVRRRGRERR
jgi:hypothetical protein